MVFLSFTCLGKDRKMVF